MRALFYFCLLVSVPAYASFGGSFSHGGGGGGGGHSSAHSSGHSSSGHSFGGSYARPTPTPRAAPIVRPTPSYAPPPSPQATPHYQAPRVEHHHYGSGSGSNGFMNGWLWGTLMSPKHHTTVVQQPAAGSGYVDDGQYVDSVRVQRSGFSVFWDVVFTIAFLSLVIWFIRRYVL